MNLKTTTREHNNTSLNSYEVRVRFKTKGKIMNLAKKSLNSYEVRVRYALSG